MTYNIHPLLVHFPIAFLVVYSVLRIIPLNHWFPNVAWKDIRVAFLVFGVLGAFAALSTGETAEYLVHPDHNLVEMHSFFASLSTWLYGLLLAGEILAFLNKKFIPKLLPASLVKLSVFLDRVFTQSIVFTLLAVGGLITISVTGLLGGVMVYGVSADPIAPLVLKILGLSV